ncbi:MAG: hypothetical protein NC226_09330 [Bacteroides cellulosilyticus]|nr:hypothetical protein [Bacteroides cellulosilyticus]
MTQKEKLQKAILVLDSFENKSDLFYNDIKTLMDETEWQVVNSFLKANNKKALIISANQITKRDKLELTALRDEFVSRIKSIDQEEYSTTLADKANESQIYHNRHSTIIAYLALFISILATTPLPQKFYDWVCSLFGRF